MFDNWKGIVLLNNLEQCFRLLYLEIQSPVPFFLLFFISCRNLSSRCIGRLAGGIPEQIICTCRYFRFWWIRLACFVRTIDKFRYGMCHLDLNLICNICPSTTLFTETENNQRCILKTFTNFYRIFFYLFEKKKIIHPLCDNIVFLIFLVCFLICNAFGICTFYKQ